MVTMTLLLWLNASHFDWTEIKSIIGIFLFAAGTEGVMGRLNKDKGNLRLPGGQLVDSSSYWQGFKDAGGES